MTKLYLTQAAARRMGANLNDSVESPEPRKKRRATTHTSAPPSSNPESTGEHTGLFGGTLHRWHWLSRHNSWLSHCSRIQKHHRPEQGEGVRCDQGCYQEEVDRG